MLLAAVQEEEEEEEHVRLALKMSLEEDRLAKRRRVEDFSDADVALAMEASLQQEASRPGLLSLVEFVELWRRVEVQLSCTTTVIEKGSLVRNGNRSSSGQNQSKAQYGRLLFCASDEVLSLLEVSPKRSFVDIGHGIGNVCIQAALTRGCESAGIELVEHRNFVSSEFWRACLEDLSVNHFLESRGDCHLECGDLVKNIEWLATFDAAFVNNFNEVLGARACGRDNQVTPDDVVAYIFSKMKKKAKMLTLQRLNLGPDRDQVNEKRIKKGLAPRHDASFFTLETVTLKPTEPQGYQPDDGHSLDKNKECVVSWGTMDIEAYLYTRVTDVATFFCSHCTYDLPTAAFDAPGILRSTCIVCGLKANGLRSSSSSSRTTSR